MTKGRAEIRKERIESWFSDLTEEFEYSFSAEDLKKERERRIIKRGQGDLKLPSIFSIVADKPPQISSDQPLILLTALQSDAPDSSTEFIDRIYEKLDDILREEEINMRVVRVKEPATEETSRNLGRQHDAAVVIWGSMENDIVHLIMDLQKNKSIALEHNSSINVNPPRRIKFRPVSNLIDCVPYFSRFFIGSSYYACGDPDKAGLCFEEVLELLPADNSLTIGPDESLFFRVIWSYS